MRREFESSLKEQIWGCGETFRRRGLGAVVSSSMMNACQEFDDEVMLENESEPQEHDRELSN